jgi:hypothetical protein
VKFLAGKAIQVSTVDLAGAALRKSSRSGQGNNANCVEVAFAWPAVAVRDSKSPDSGALALSPSGWHAFLRTMG